MEIKGKEAIMYLVDPEGWSVELTRKRSPPSEDVGIGILVWCKSEQQAQELIDDLLPGQNIKIKDLPEG